jgi:2-dehydropantoate 2-reductase
MRVAVIGCGAVGSLFAAALAQVEGVEVWAYDLDEAHVRAINEHELRITGAGEVVGRVRATADARELPPCDFGIVAVKSMHTDRALADTAHAFADGGAVCSVQNGAGNEELIAAHVREVIRGTTFPAGHIVEPGHVAWDTKGDTHIGPFEPSPAPMAKVEALAEVCTRGGMPTRALEDARGAQWRKLIFNAASNAIGALTGLTHGRIAEPPTRDLAWAVMAEGRAVADAQGITLDRSPEELFDFAARKEIAYDHKPSMLQDVEAGRQTEIDFLNGAVVSFGERHGVDAPLNRALTALVKGLERSHG